MLSTSIVRSPTDSGDDLASLCSVDMHSKCSPSSLSSSISVNTSTNQKLVASTPGRTTDVRDAAAFSVVKHVATFLCLCLHHDKGIVDERVRGEGKTDVDEEAARPEHDRENRGLRVSDASLLNENEERQDEETRSRLQAQEYLRDAIFDRHEFSIRSYCRLAHQMAAEANFKIGRLRHDSEEQDPELTSSGSCSLSYSNDSSIQSFRSKLDRSPTPFGRQHIVSKHASTRKRFVQIIIAKMFRNVPLSIMLDVSDSIFETGLHSTIAVFQISSFSINVSLALLSKNIKMVLGRMHTIIPFPHRNRNVSSNSFSSSSNGSSTLSSHTNILLRTSLLNDKMLSKLNRYNSTAKVISYMEREDDALPEHAKKRVQKMMHYEVPLRPFVATVMVAGSKSVSPVTSSNDPSLLFSNSTSNPFQNRHHNASSLQIFPSSADNTSLRSLVQQEHERTTANNYNNGNSVDVNAQGSTRIQSSSTITISSSSAAPIDESPFMMCTPKSFPPTPSSRSIVMARGTRFAEDVVFLARDQLRVEGAITSPNARTRAMAKALQAGSRLAVFNHQNGGIHLTCGQHCATKASSALYCSVRSMIPILRNCYVYFEMTVLPPPPIPSTNSGVYPHTAPPLPSLAIGYSTLEMPLQNLVGAWESSAGLCTHGQILACSQWISPLTPAHPHQHCSFGNGNTVGCLALLEDYGNSHIATLSMTFNVDGHVVTLPLCGVAPIRNASSLIGGGHCYNNTTTSNTVPSTPLYPGKYNNDVNHHRQSKIHMSLGRMPLENNTLQILVPRQEEIFPTLTLHSPATQVLCRFSSEDICATRRSSIGAPEGVTVYAVDGSVLFDECVNTINYGSCDQCSSLRSSCSDDEFCYKGERSSFEADDEHF